jgi:membrane protein required for colicin V production
MIIDIIIAFLLIASIAIGIKRGLVKELVMIAGLILGFYFASAKYPLLEKYLFKSAVTLTHHIISFLIILIVVFFVIYLIGLLLKKIIQLIMLGWLDKILGSIAGLVKGAIIIWLLLMLIMTIFPKTQQSLNKSFLAVKIMEYGSRITKLPIKTTPVKKPVTVAFTDKSIIINNCNSIFFLTNF